LEREFLKGSDALIILSIGQFINAATGPVSNILMMTGKQKLNRNMMVGTTILAIILDFILIPRYGIIGAASVNTFGVILMNVIPFFLIKRFYGFYTLDFTDLFNVKPKEFIKQAKQLMKKDKKKKGDGDETIADDTMNNVE
jgi:O-antigen/teichoic acid export membrane protein